jgi:predicted transcriptional regulator YheO
MNEDGDIISNFVRFSKEAKVELARIMNKITDRQNSEDETEATKTILPKQKTYLPRFAILLHILDCYDNGVDFNSEIEQQTILNAERLVDYFICMAEKIMQDGQDYSNLKASANDKVVKTSADKFAMMYAANPKLNRVEAAGLLKVSRSQIYNWIKQIDNES